MDRQFIIIVCVGLYMAACIGVGLWAMRRTKNAGDFFMAGRHLGAFVTAMAIFSSTLSGFGFVGGPGLVYRMGMSSVWMVVCVTMGYALSFFLLAKRLRLFAEVLQPISLPDVVATRYQSRRKRPGRGAPGPGLASQPPGRQKLPADRRRDVMGA
ncbi:MAG: hypothetical protein ABGX07_21790, partial [Pirellulaceae bacterium]